MIVTSDLKIPRQEFSQLVKDSIEYDMKQNLVDETIKEGIVYKKALKTYKQVESKVSVCIETLNDEVIETSTTSNNTVITSSYQMEDSTDGVMVTYKEDIQTDKWLHRLNYKIMSFIYNKQNKKKILTQWQMMENYYKETTKKD